MPSLDLLSSGFDAMRQGQYRANTAAAEIARAGAPANAAATSAIPLQPATGQPAASTRVDSNRPVNLVDSLVELQQAQREVETGAAVIDTADEVLGTLIDTRA
ncbi:Flagellar basal body rod FlgEFG protein C-terminal [Halopseudomonas litoralis]|uniref:Flagellar basal body rod FlgEFG protein C-terminal n=1 Tax=Halopseudomonas litoralis TaxID=797277 RepID=A0A1H1LJP3_9GAMM|nr:flagellar basal body rod C-terminal domain-containing protein [Halopseudomonas litoralis]SDR74542.1 Flagellar basal body rod FlgEFG protein C-terminal [Halopseudomonas litoralis]